MSNTIDRNSPEWPHCGACKETARLLRQVQELSGQSMWQLFPTWIDLCHLAVDRLPSLLTEIIQEGAPRPDPDEIAERWRKMTQQFRYHPAEALKLFAQAFGVLLEASYRDGKPTFADVVGSTYMEVFPYRSGKDSRGQFFTPWNVATFMAEMVLGGGQAGQMCTQRLEAAAKSNPLARALALTISAWPDRKVATQKFWEKLIPYVLPRVEPVTICDPACGSGIMLLAAAKEFPSWAMALGLVKFFGVDIDSLCVDMARLNMRLYGISPLGVKPADILALGELQALPWPYNALYENAVTDEPPGRAFWQEGVNMARAGQLELWPGLEKLPRAREPKAARRTKTMSGAEEPLLWMLGKERR